MIVAHPADGDEAMTGRKSTTTILRRKGSPDCILAVSLFCCFVFLWRFFQFR